MPPLALAFALALCVSVACASIVDEPVYANATNPHYRTVSPLLFDYSTLSGARAPDDKRLRAKRAPFDENYLQQCKRIAGPDAFDWNFTVPGEFAARKIVDLSVHLFGTFASLDQANVTFDGKQVRLFSDVRTANGSACFEIAFTDMYYIDGGFDANETVCEPGFFPLIAGYIEPLDSLLSNFGGLSPTLSVWNIFVETLDIFGLTVCLEMYFDTPTPSAPAAPAGFTVAGHCVEPFEPMPSPRTVNSTLAISNASESANISQLFVAFQSRNPTIHGAINLRLAHGASATTLLNTGCVGANLTVERDIDVMFADGAAPAVCGVPAEKLNATFAPRESFAVFTGAPLSGDWTLTYADAAPEISNSTDAFWYRWCVWVSYETPEASDAPVESLGPAMVTYMVWLLLVLNAFAVTGLAQLSRPPTPSVDADAPLLASGRRQNRRVYYYSPHTLAILSLLALFGAAASFAYLVPVAPATWTVATLLAVFALWWLLQVLTVQLLDPRPEVSLITVDGANFTHFLAAALAAIVSALAIGAWVLLEELTFGWSQGVATGAYFVLLGLYVFGSARARTLRQALDRPATKKH